MVGALVEIGRGGADAGDVGRWLDGEIAPPLVAAPAAGLFLEAVRYAGEPAELPPLEPVGIPRPFWQTSGRPRAGVLDSQRRGRRVNGV
jgi:hypothetical protein